MTLRNCGSGSRAPGSARMAPVVRFRLRIEKGPVGGVSGRGALSTGQAAGQIKRLKMIKRQMYGGGGAGPAPCSSANCGRCPSGRCTAVPAPGRLHECTKIVEDPTSRERRKRPDDETRLQHQILHL